MPIEINDLESSRFGVVSAKLVDHKADLSLVDAQVRQAGVNLLTARVSVDDLALVHDLEADGFRLMDTLVYYAVDPALAPKPWPELTCGVVRLAKDTDKSAIEMIAAESFEHYPSHYHMDPRLDDSAVIDAYIDWAGTSLDRMNDSHLVIVAESKNRVVGFLTFRLQDRPLGGGKKPSQEFQIVLNAVGTNSRGKGVYSALLANVIGRASAAGAVRVSVSTQLNNYAVQRVWSRLGFMHYDSAYTFHKWFDP